MPVLETRSTQSPVIGVSGMVFNLALTTGLAFGIARVFGKDSLTAVLRAGNAWPLQLVAGAAVGLLLTGPLMLLLKRVRRFDPLRRQLVELLSRADLRGFNPLWFALCAGIGEELLFRGALQPLCGLWLSSALFTLAHFQTGAFGTMNRMKAFYALFVGLASLALGLLFQQVGLLAAVVAHTTADVVAGTQLRNVSKQAALRC